ncbi:hypothetical protein VTJ49DRAFT_3642 [Mycothermus thermophilus]|uniref:Uncharacterized protein n=1 Tax=Humicola insolens TaxID=85995 RepID=A0ABR3V745_HUMIN
MTALVRTRQPLQVLSMSNQPELRRQSKRLAGTSKSVPVLPSRPVPSSSQESQSQPVQMAASTARRKRKDADADLPSAAAAVYDEQDGDFLFTRGSKRVKTTQAAPAPPPPPPPPPPPAVPEEDDDELADQPPAKPVKRGPGRPPKGGRTRRASPPAPEPKSARTKTPSSPPPQPAPKSQSTRSGAARATRSKRKSDDAPPPPPPEEEEEEEVVAPKAKTRRKTRETAAATERRQPTRGAGKAPRQVNGSRRGIPVKEPQEDSEVMDDSRREQQEESAEATPGVPPRSQSQTIPLPFSDTPIINRNKEFRKKGGASGSRRSSLGMRGRRASSLIDNGQSALPHREVDPAEYYKYIAADGLSEPRRMKQLLIWCGERALAKKPPHGTNGSSAILGARAIQDQLLKDFGQRSEFSDWFVREDAPAPPVPVVLQPNPRNVHYDAQIAELEAKIERLKAQKAAWQAITHPLPTIPPLFPPPPPPQQQQPPSSSSSTDQQQQQPPPPPPQLHPPGPPDPSLLSESESAILSSLTNPSNSFSAFQRQARSRLQNAQAQLEWQVDRLADGVHKLDMRVVTAGREAEAVLAACAGRLKERERREKEKVGMHRVGVMEVLRCLARVLPPEGG